MNGEPSQWPRAATWALLAIGAAIRVNNAIVYPTFFGFDADYNWEYVEHLRTTWSLPRPEDGWSFAHPPFFYYLSALLVRVLGLQGPEFSIVLVRLLSSAVGLAAIVATVALVRRVDPGNERRAFLAAGLLVFLPAHIQMSASFGEEILTSAFATGAIAIAAWPRRTGAKPLGDLGRDVWIGLLVGLSMLTKLSGVLLLPAVCGARLLEGWEHRRVSRAVGACAVAVIIATAMGGWFYARNLVSFGYLYPHDLPVHGLMHGMPPGKRTLLDYAYIPLSTFTNPHMLQPGLVRSVWGGTYATFWFDGHRHFVPAQGDDVRWAGGIVLALALLPTAAFFVGAARGVRRALGSVGGPDTPLLLLVACTAIGYVAFTWRNPWFAAVKGTYLLGAMLPFAFYASESLARWTGAGRRRAVVWAALGALAAAICLVFTHGAIWSGGSK